MADIYYAATAQGSNDGTSAANAYAYDNATDGWNASAKQQPGNTLHVCGTISIASGSNALTAVNSGTTGNPITFKFETGAILTSTNFGNNGAVYVPSKAYWVIDGGTNGIIESTDNGSSPTYGHQTDSVGIYMPNCSNCRVTSITVRNMYVKNTSDSQGEGDSIDLSGSSDSRIDHTTVHDAKFCVNWSLNGSPSNIEIDHNVFYHCNWGVAIGASSDTTVSNILFHDNEVYDWQNWDDLVGNQFHHNGIHVFTQGGTGAAVISGVQVYNNYFHGDPGTRMTANVYLEAGSGTIASPLVFNNIMMMETNNPSNGFSNSQSSGTGIVTTPGYYNNLIGYVVNTGGLGIRAQGTTGVISKNNIFINCGQVYYPDGGSMGSSDYNDFFGVTCYGPGVGDNTTLAAWQGATGFDSHSINTDPALVSFVPLASSPVYHAGSSLNGLGITELNTSKNVVARGTGPWTMGPNDAVDTANMILLAATLL